VNTFSYLFKLHYNIGLGLNKKEQAEYYLIERYIDQVSDRLIKRQQQLIDKANIEGPKQMRLLTAHPNPFLTMIPTSEFGGKYPPVPIIIK
jgi:hypothetical protein